MYDFQAFQNGNWFLKNIVGNWNLGLVYTFESHGRQPRRRCQNRQRRPPISGSPVSLGSYVATNPNARYIEAGPGAYANGGRNTFPLGRIDNFDASLLKRVSVNERMHVEIGAQFYNVLNHSQFIAGYLNDIAPRAFTTSRNFLAGQPGLRPIRPVLLEQLAPGPTGAAARLLTGCHVCMSSPGRALQRPPRFRLPPWERRPSGSGICIPPIRISKKRICR